MTRVVSALAGIPVVLGVILLPGDELFRWIMAAVAAIAAWEYASFCALGVLLRGLLPLLLGFGLVHGLGVLANSQVRHGCTPSQF